jgi:short subunit dehydrogenase-like uncharacterized protein
MGRVLVYGAYGYTGRLVVQELLKRRIKPFLAGRNEEKLRTFAEAYELNFRAFPLSNLDVLRESLRNVEVVIHCAGPFKYTAWEVAKACLETHTHYLDITGEYEVFDRLQSLDDMAREESIMILPGAGFDVVPSDCLANYLKEKMPDASELSLAFVSKGASVSRGTQKTMIENMGHPQQYRKNGIYHASNIGDITRRVDFGYTENLCTLISWGDISTAYYSTSIPNIKVFAGITSAQLKNLQRVKKFSWLLRLRFVKRYLLKKVDRKKYDGPDDERRMSSHAYFWGEVKNAEGQSWSARLQTPNGYTLTADSVATITERILDEDYKAGYQTPATAYGWRFLSALNNVDFLHDTP